MYTKIRLPNSPYIFYFKSDVYRKTVTIQSKTSFLPREHLYWIYAEAVVNWYDGKIERSKLSLEELFDKALMQRE